MLFAACTNAAPKPLQHSAHVANNLGQQQLTTLQQLKDQHVMSFSSTSSSSSSTTSSVPSSALQTPGQMSPQHQMAATGNAVTAATVAAAVAARANDEAKEAMRKLDATLVAYLAGETKLQAKQLEPELELDLDSQNESSAADGDEYVLEGISAADTDADEQTVEKMTREELKLFGRIKSMKLQLEALTLEPEGTKRMELLLNETRPIFTVECQLSHELIEQVPRYEMFHIMQFESEKFNSLTQCTRFGQEAQRDINLTPLIDEFDAINGNGNGNGNDAASSADLPNFGRIHFAVWWREPGTCLNEMLGMGVFELRELYDAALLEQCKRITIQRRGVPLANIYLKINLLLCTLADTNNNNATDVVTYEPAGDAIKEHGGKKKKAGSRRGRDGIAAKSTKISASSSADAAASSNTTDETKDGKDVKPDAGKKKIEAATLKVRLLTGLIVVSEMRGVETDEQSEYHLHIDRFWRSEPATALSTGEARFYYEEQFAVIRDRIFLSNVNQKHLRIRIFHRVSSVLCPLGFALLPLHQFFIAYSNDMMSNHLITHKLPVISIDAFIPITDLYGLQLGEIKCLLAMGSAEQIDNLKRQRELRPLHTDMFSGVGIERGDDPFFPHIRMPLNEYVIKDDVAKEVQETVEMLEVLENALTKIQFDAPASEQQTAVQAPVASTSAAAAAAAAAALKKSPEMTTGNTSDVMKTSPSSGAATLEEGSTFQFELTIVGANGLVPYNNKILEADRFPPGELPTTYVTFHAEDCEGHSSSYNSEQGTVYATKIVDRSVHPQWNQKLWITASTKYLDKPEEAFILKLWRRAKPPRSGNFRSKTVLKPTPEQDAIIGYAEVYISVFVNKFGMAGVLPVIDINGWVRAQLEVKANYLEFWIEKLMANEALESELPPEVKSKRKQLMTDLGSKARSKSKSKPKKLTKVPETVSSSKDLLDDLDLNLAEAVKEKCKELEDIAERLRRRLADVTGLAPTEKCSMSALYDWLPFDEELLAELDDDELLNEFMHDVNYSPTEEDAEEFDDDIVISDNEVIKTDDNDANKQSDKKEN